MTNEGIVLIRKALEYWTAQPTTWQTGLAIGFLSAALSVFEPFADRGMNTKVGVSKGEGVSAQM